MRNTLWVGDAQDPSPPRALSLALAGKEPPLVPISVGIGLVPQVLALGVGDIELGMLPSAKTRIPAHRSTMLLAIAMAAF